MKSTCQQRAGQDKHLAATAGGQHGDGGHKAGHRVGVLVQHVHAQAVLLPAHLRSNRDAIGYLRIQ